MSPVGTTTWSPYLLLSRPQSAHLKVPHPCVLAGTAGPSKSSASGTLLSAIYGRRSPAGDTVAFSSLRVAFCNRPSLER